MTITAALIVALGLVDGRTQIPPTPLPATSWTPEQTDCGKEHLARGAALPDWMQGGVPAAREAMWEGRYALSAMCLFNASKLWIGVDNARSADLGAMARIRVRYDAFRCRDFERERRPNAYVALAQTRELESGAWLSAVPEGAPDAFRVRMAAVAVDPRTYEYDFPLETACADRGGVKPQSEWGAARSLLQNAYGS